MSVNIFLLLSCFYQIGFFLRSPKCSAHFPLYGFTLTLFLLGNLATTPCPRFFLFPEWLPHLLPQHSSLHSIIHLVSISVLYLYVLSYHLDVISLRTGYAFYFFLLHLNQYCANILGILNVQIVQSKSPLNRRLWRKFFFSFLAQFSCLFTISSLPFI